MSDIRYFNVELNLNDGTAKGVYPNSYYSNEVDNDAFGIKKGEQFNYKGGDYDVYKTLCNFLKDHNPVSRLTVNNINDSYVKSYFDCVRTDELYEALYKYAEVYEDLYNGYCNNTARGGKTTLWNTTNGTAPIPVPVLTSPVIVSSKNGETSGNDEAEIFIKIRGIPIPMRKYKLSDNTLIWKFPEYAFGFDNAIDCMSTAAIPTNPISEASYTDNTFKRDAAKNPPNYTQVNSDNNTTEIRLGTLNIVPDVNE